LGCAFSPDGRFILSVSKDRSLKLWDTHSGRCLTTLYVDGSLVDCAWFPDGQHFVAVGARGAYFLRLIQ
jgi:WD40 repeat protein